MDCSKEVASGFVIAGGNGTKLFKFGKEILNQMPRLVQLLVIGPRHRTITFRRNDGRFASLRQRRKHACLGVISFIRQHDRCGNRWEKYVGTVQVAGLPAGQMKPGRITQRIDGRVDLGA